MLSYEDAVKYIADNPRPGKEGAPMEVSASGGRTRYVWLAHYPFDRVVDVRLFGHLICRIFDDGRYVLDSCGYATPTTRDALNAVVGPASVYSEGSLWWYRGWPFRDGMTVRGLPPRVSYKGADEKQVVFDDPRKR